MRRKLQECRWTVGQGFYYENLCFINQIEGGDEWLAIRNDLSFESFSFEGYLQSGTFDHLIERLLAATDDQLKRLAY
jgi:hypothetical protein